uniref:WAT1-related protein n=1 Tax=Oryza barthii TaxID=65489 RepID=A0A0D3GRU1_9ORYZ
MGNGGIKAYAAIVLIRLMYSGMHVMSKVALDQGMSPFVFVFYRHGSAALVLIPAVLILERPKAKQVTLKIAAKMFVHALYGMESMKLKKLHGNVKAAGILFCVTGVTVLAFYQGPMLGSFNHHHLFQQANSSDDPAGNTHSKTQWVLGIFLMTLSNVLAGLWTVLLGPLIEETSKLMNTALQISWAAVQAFVVAVAVERDFNKWKLGWDVELATGVVVTALSYYMQMWTITKRGPVFLAMSMPLTFIFTIIISSFILGDPTSLGSIFAGTLLIGGLYNVLWGKNIEEQDEVNDIVADKPEFEKQGKEAQMPGDAGTKV